MSKARITIYHSGDDPEVFDRFRKLMCQDESGLERAFKEYDVHISPLPFAETNPRLDCSQVSFTIGISVREINRKALAE